MRHMENNKLRTRTSALILVLAMVISLFEGMSAVKVEAASLLEPIISDPVWIGYGRLEGANTSKNLAVGNDGAIYAVYQGTDEHTIGAVCIRKSVDNGMTFGDEVVVAPNGTECEVAVSSTNRVFVSYHVQTGMTEGSISMPIYDTYVAYSDDLENEDFISVKVPEVGIERMTGVWNEEKKAYDQVPILQYPYRHHMAVNGDYVYVISSDGVNLFISDDGGETYTLKEISEQTMAYTVPMVDKDTGAIMILRDNPRVDYYYNTNADGSGDFTYYKYWALDFDLKEQGVCDVYYSTADYGKYNGKGYLYTSGAFGYIYRIEVGKEMSESSWTKNSSINPNNVVEYPATSYDDIFPNTQEPPERAPTPEQRDAYGKIFNGRSLTADYKGNVAVGYVIYSMDSDTGKAYYQVSHDGGTTFGAGVEVANATAANAAINPIVGSLLYMYESNDKVYLVTVENVLENYDVTANPTTLVFSPDDAGTGIPRKFLITNNTDDELPVPQVIASEGFEVTVGDDSVPAHGTLEVSVVYKDPTVKDGTVTVKYEDGGGNPQELKVKVALSNTIKGADAANAAASTTSITVEDIDSETYYALFTTDGGEADEMIRGWISGAITPEDAAALENVELSGTKLIFTGLDPDTAYVVRTVSKEAYEATEYDNPDYYEDAKVMTAIDTMGKVEGSTYKPVITPGETTITVTGLDPQYTYGLYDSKGKDIATGGSFRAPSGGKVEFTGLTSGTTYYFAAKSADNSECDKIKTRTLSSATPSPSPTPTPTTHEHDIEYTVEGMTIKARCVTEEPDTCEYYDVSTDVNIVFDKEADVSEGDYVQVTITCADPEVTPFDIDEPQVTYTGTTEEGDPYNSSEMPTEKGSYEITVKVDDKSVSWEFEIDTKLDENGDPVMDDGKEVLEVIPKYHWVYPGYGIDYNNGHLWYTQAQYNAGSDADKAVFNKKNDDGTEYLYNFVAIDDEKAARKELINRPESNDGSAVPADLYIDMFTEHLSVPAGKKIASYCLTKGGKWVNGELTDELIQRAFGKSETQIAISYTELSDSKQKKPSGTIYTFVKVDKRPACSPLKINYAVCADKTGRTPGQFILTDGDGKYMYNCSNKFDITFASKDEVRNPATVGWGVWPSTGGVWVPEILKDDNGKLKAGKVVIYVRTTAKKSSSGTKFTPSSKVKKLSVSTSQKATSVKADYKKETLKLKKGVVAYFGTEIIDITKEDFYAITKDYGTEIYPVIPEPVSEGAAEAVMVTFETLTNKYPEELSFDDYEDMIVDYDEDVASNQDLKKKGIDLRGYLTTARNTVLVWTKANDKKPASITTAIKFAKRGVIDKSVESLVTIDEKGKAGIAKLGPDKKVNLEIKVTDKKGKVSWKTSIPMAAKTDLVTAAGVDYQIAESIYEIRVKYDAKGGKEDDTSNAAGVSRFVLVTFKNIGTDKSIKVGVEKVEFFDTEDLAKAAKKIVEPEPEPEPTT